MIGIDPWRFAPNTFHIPIYHEYESVLYVRSSPNPSKPSRAAAMAIPTLGQRLLPRYTFGLSWNAI
jgi:hypothetical protein